MTKKNGTKRSLLMSAVALVLCFSMLVGSTFAWFTDSVTSSGNIIKSGKLDVEMYYAEGDEAVPTTDAGWTNAASGAIFNYDKWEPGYVDAKHIQIKNVGNLAFKYKLNIVANGEVSKLADVIDVYYLSTAAQVTRDMIAAATPIGTLAKLITDPDGAAYGTLLAEAGKDTTTVTIALKMRESAGNEYQELSIGSDFSVQLLAAQLEAEEDVFDKTYDKFADYDGEISNATTLAAALAKDGTYKVVSDITVDEAMTVPAGVTVNLDLNGKTITGTKGRDANNNRIHTLVNNGTLNLVGGTVKSAGNDGGSAIYNNAGATLTIEDVTVYGAPQSDPVYEAGVTKPFPSYAVNNYGDAVVNGATVKSYHGAIATGGNGVTVINDADIDVGLGQSTGITSYLIYSFDNAKVTVNDGKFAFTKQEIYVNGGNTFCELGTNPIIINGGNYTGTSFSTGAGREYVIKGGTFDADPSAHVATGYDVLDNGDGTYTVVKGVVASSAADLKNAVTAGGDIVLTGTVDLGGASDAFMTLDKDTTITGGTIKGTGWTGELNYAVNATDGNIVFDGVTFDTTGWSTVGWANWGISANVNGTANVTFKNCTFKGGQCPIYQSGADSVITLEGCTFDTTTTAIQCEIYSGDFQLGQDLIIKNCDFTGVADVLHIYDHDKDPSSEAIAQYLTANGNIFTGVCKQTCN